MSLSDDAGGAATSDGASARGGAGMNEDERGFSPATSQFATGAPSEWMRVRGRRARGFFSGAAGRAAAAGTGTGFGACFGAAFGGGGGAGFFDGTTFSVGFAFGLGAGFAFRAAGFGAFFAVRFDFERAAGFLAVRFGPAAVFFPCTFAIRLSPPKGPKMNGAI